MSFSLNSYYKGSRVDVGLVGRAHLDKSLLFECINKGFSSETQLGSFIFESIKPVHYDSSRAVV